MKADHPFSPVKIIAGSDPFGASLKDSLVAHLREKGLQVDDLGVDKYYSIAEKVASEVSLYVEKTDEENKDSVTRGLVVCGSGCGVAIFANKFPRVYAALCHTVDDAKNARSINNSNVLALGANLTDEGKGKQIIDAWLETAFKSPCPASKGEPWPDEIVQFLENSLPEMAKIPNQGVAKSKECVICDLAATRDFSAVSEMPGGSWKVIREDPTTATVKFSKGSIEPAHHHTFSHDIVVISGRKKVQNLTVGSEYLLGPGDFLSTPAGDRHRVYYYEDTEFFIKWDGKADILLDEDFETARKAISPNASIE